MIRNYIQSKSILILILAEFIPEKGRTKKRYAYLTKVVPKHRHLFQSLRYRLRYYLNYNYAVF